MNKKIVFLPYDMDTAIGINNEGALVLDYNLEDTDTLDGAEVFNGQSSVLWNNLRECFPDELKAMYQQLRSSGALSYARVEEAFEAHQSVWPEAVFNEDAFFKYIQPLMDDGDESYLSMLQGSKEEQRKWWLSNRFKYIDSKYNAGDSLTDRIQLRGYNKANIVVTPYADIYASIKWGSYLDNQRAPRNIAKTMVCPMDNLNDTEIYIYSASQLASIGDLSGLKVGFADFHNAIKLQELILGSTESGYSNSNLRSVNVGNLKLLRKIDVRNCVGLGTFSDQKTVDLSGCSGIEEVYFDGTSILGVELPNGGFLKKLHLPGTITNLTVKNQKNLTEFVCPDYSNISTLVLENNSSAINIGDIVDDVASGCRIRLYNYRLDFNSVADVHDFLDKFEGMTGIDQNGNNLADPQIAITVHVPSADGDDIDGIIARYPDITVDADVATYYVRYYDWEGHNILYTETVAKGGNGSYAATPAHEQTEQYTFAFTGWSSRRRSTTNEPDCRNNVNNNINVYAAYNTTVRTYTVTFKNSDGTTLQTIQNVPYGGTAVYTGETPVHATEPDNMQFLGFEPTGANITGVTNCIAQYLDTNTELIKYLHGTLTEYEDDELSTIGNYGLFGLPKLINVKTAATRLSNGSVPSGYTDLLQKVELTYSGSEQIRFENSSLRASGFDFEALIIRSQSIPNLVAQIGQVLPNERLKRLELVIYVPRNMLATYIADSNFSMYKKNIKAIEDYPVTDLSTIPLTWAQIKAAIDDETFFNGDYTVGDVKQFVYDIDGEEQNCYAEIRYIDSVNKYVDFVIAACQEKIKMNSVSSMVKYSQTLAKERLDEIYANGLQSDLKSVITPIDKKYYCWDGSTETVQSHLWMLNSQNMPFSAAAYIKENDPNDHQLYSSMNDIPYTRCKRVGSGASSFWTGSAYNSSNFISTYNSNSSSSGPKSECALAFGFRIAKSN